MLFVFFPFDNYFMALRIKSGDISLGRVCLVVCFILVGAVNEKYDKHFLFKIT